MVWFAEDPDLRNSKDPFEILDPPPTDLSFADSFLDFDSIQNWFEDKSLSSVDMAAQRDNTNVINEDTSVQMIETPVSVASVGIPESENLVTFGDAIEEGIGNISLVGGFESSGEVSGNGVRIEVMADKGEDEGESPESESSSTSSSSSSSSSSASSGSSDSGSDSDSDSDSDDDSEEGEHPDKKRAGKIKVTNVELEEGEIRDSDDGQELVTETDFVDDSDDDDVEKMFSLSGMNDDNDDDAGCRPIRSKNELEALPPVPPVDVTLEPHHQIQPVGVVMSIMGAKVVVEGLEKHDPLDEGSILWMTESRTPLGLIDEVFGPVRNPYYVVRYNSENEVPAGICEGALISFVPEFANHVLNNKDLYKKGYDASGCNDEEETAESEFSDDEKEAEYRRMKSLTKRGFHDKILGNKKNHIRKGVVSTVSNRGFNDQNPINRKNTREKIPETAWAMPAIPLLDKGNYFPSSGIFGRGPDGGNTIASPLPPTSMNPYSASNGIQTNGASFPQPQSALLPNGFPTNGASWFSQNPHNSYQFPVPENPFQCQLNPSQGSISTNMFPVVVQPNIYAQGFVGQDQMTFGLSSHFLQVQPPMCVGEQVNFFNQMPFETNHNLRPSTIPSNGNVPGQFHRRGRKSFHRGGRKGWRTAK